MPALGTLHQTAKSRCDNAVQRLCARHRPAACAGADASSTKMMFDVD